MGRYSWSCRKTVEQCKTLDIFWLNRKGYLCGFRRGNIQWTNALGELKSSIGIEVSASREDFGADCVRLMYTVTNSGAGEKKDLDYKIRLDCTRCHFGGFRFWFVCPLWVNGRPCDRRVGKLYLPPNGIYFGCRHCYNLTYRSCKEHDSRMSALAKLPPRELARLLKSNDPKAALFSLKALFKRLDK